MTQEKKGPKFGMHPIGLSGASGRRPRKNPSRDRKLFAPYVGATTTPVATRKWAADAS